MRMHALDDAIGLASNECPYGPLPSVVRAIESATANINRYPDHRAVELREAIAEHLGIEAANVTVGCGSVGLLAQLALAYVDPGDEVVFGRPSFEAYPIFTQIAGGAPVAVPLRGQSLDLDAIANAVSSRTKLVLLANPNNPTGTAVNTEALIRLLDAVPPDCIVVADEAYREFVTRADVTDTVPLVAHHPNLVVLRTCSKAFGLAALRVGYGIADPGVVRVIDSVLIPFAVNGLGQAGALASLAARDELAERLASVTSERARVVTALRRAGWSVPDAQANFVWLPAGTQADALARGLGRQGVATRAFPGAGVRVTTALPDDNDRFLEAFTRVASSGEMDRAWLLPTGHLARRVQSILAEIDRAISRLAAHARRPTPTGLTDANPTTGERWDGGQVWAHLAEFGSYWIAALRGITDAASSDPVPFGRTKTDPHRIDEIEAHRHAPIDDQLAVVRRDAASCAATLADFTTTDWSRVGVHSTLGAMDVSSVLDLFLVGHWHEHADQLDAVHCHV